MQKTENREQKTANSKHQAGDGTSRCEPSRNHHEAFRSLPVPMLGPMLGPMLLPMVLIDGLLLSVFHLHDSLAIISSSGLCPASCLRARSALLRGPASSLPRSECGQSLFADRSSRKS